jgi:hypothetical protein
MKTLNKISQIRAQIGQHIKCNYPKHGSRNILCAQSGMVVEDGFSPNGQWYKIQRGDGSYRTLSLNKMVKPQIAGV